MLREFTSQYKELFSQAHPYQFVKIMDKYASHGWMLADTYNGLIMALGKQFERLSSRELASFCASLGKSGLRQEDIIAETVKRIEERVEPPADHP
jgi:hypothetical protein